jgi:hypothetical protein
VLVALVSFGLGLLLGWYLFDVRSRQAGTGTGSGNLSMKHFLPLAAGVVVVQVGGGFLIYRSFGGWQDRGTFGDMFGGVTALFTGLAFAGVVFAILLQRHELEMQRQVLEATRQELKRSAEAQESSEQLLSQQVQTLQQSAEAQELAGRYSAISSLLEIYDTQLTKLRQRSDEIEMSSLAPDVKRESLNEVRTTIQDIKQGRDELHTYLVTGAFQQQIYNRLLKP